jgi:DNA-binding response OmpR family regulator
VKRLLIVDDDLATCASLKSFLRGAYEVKALYEGSGLQDEARKFMPDIILLDINLPGRHGLLLLKDLEPLLPTMPVFMISVRGGEEDIVRAFDLGAADYITKPFSLAVLKSRLDRWLKKKTRSSILTLGAAALDLTSGVVGSASARVSLTRKELLTLRFLLANEGLVMSRSQILNFAWGYDYEGTPRTVDNTIASLRRKLSAVGIDAAGLFASHPGLGYSLNLPA